MAGYIGRFTGVSISSTSEEVRDALYILACIKLPEMFPLVPLPKKCVTSITQKAIDKVATAHSFPLVPLPKKCVTCICAATGGDVSIGFPLVPLPKKCMTLKKSKLRPQNYGRFH